MSMPLSQLDPTEAWQPAGATHWSPRWAAHLYRRAAFGVPTVRADGPRTGGDALQDAVRRGRDACLDELLAGRPGEDDLERLIDTAGESVSRATPGAFSSRPPTERLQGWWLYRMLHSGHPLRERMTLFWHDHFATSIAKVRKLRLMFEQNRLLRTHALGRFPELLRAISRDPAMMVWLDSASNVKDGPNENFARELLELFTLGTGHYSEQDVRETARAFTGWANAEGAFVFRADLHDDGPKTVLGQTGNWNGDDVVRIVLEQPAAARFLAGKLFRQFISEDGTPPEPLIEPLAEELSRTGYDIAAALEMILRSRLFFSETAWRARIKSPVEYVMGLVRTFDARPPLEALARAMDGLGQSLFEPPSVKGWDGGTAWLNSATLLARHNLAAALLNDDSHFGEALPVADLVQQHAGEDPEQQVGFLLDLLLQGEVRAADRGRLVEFASARPLTDSRLRELVHQIVMMPEYQLA